MRYPQNKTTHLALCLQPSVENAEIQLFPLTPVFLVGPSAGLEWNKSKTVSDGGARSCLGSVVSALCDIIKEPAPQLCGEARIRSKTFFSEG